MAQAEGRPQLATELLQQAEALEMAIEEEADCPTESGIPQDEEIW